MAPRTRLIIVLLLFLAGLGISYALEGCTGRSVLSGGRGGVPQRIIAMAPSVVETLYAVNAGDRVVGVGQHCFYPPEAKAKPRCGGDVDPNFERMLALQPDLVIVQGEADKVDAFCRRYGIGLLHVRIEDLESLEDGIRSIGHEVGCDDEATALLSAIQQDLEAVKRRVARQRRPKVFLCLGRQAGSLRSLFSVGGATFLSQVLAVAGGDNVLAAEAIRYPTVSKESLVGLAPDVILEIHAGSDLSEGVRRQLRDDWAVLGSLPAVRDGRIHILTDDYLLLPGPRVARIAERFAAVLHPDAEGDDGR